MDAERYRSAVAHAVELANVARGDDWARGEASRLDPSAISSAISTKSKDILAQDTLDRGKFGFIVARVGRGGAPVSIKPSNLARDISRTVQVVALFGLAEAAMATTTEPLRVLNALVGLCFAGYAATRANIGYSDACVLHAAWKIAVGREPRFVTPNELIAARLKIATSYKAPKCASETEILDAIENLCGLKAMRPVGDWLVLQEKIVFFEDGSIKN